MKSKARLAGLIDSPEWTKEMENYRTLLEREASLPLPGEMLMAYAKELPDKEKLAIALALEFPFAKRELRKWPDMLFVKMLRTALQQSQRDAAIKRRLTYAILVTLTTPIDESLSMETLLEEHDERIRSSGYWLHYWSFFFHQDKAQNNELWLKEIKRLESLKSHNAKEPLPRSPSSEPSGSMPELMEPDKFEKKLKLIEGLYKKESSARQRLEHELAQKDKLLRMKTKELEQFENELDRLREEVDQSDAKADQAEQARQARERRWKLEQASWLEERNSFMEHMRSLNVQVSQLERKTEQQKKELDMQEKNKTNLRQEIGDMKNQLFSTDLMASKLTESVELEVAEMSQTMTLARASSSRAGSGHEFAVTRARIRKALDLLDALEHYRQDDAELIPGAAPVVAYSNAGAHADSSYDAMQTAKQLPDLPLPNAAPDAASRLDTEPSAPALYGTFYRRDHGGYIKLENGETFNITESLVHHHELQHEAELLCTPAGKQQPGKPFIYDLQLLFQGDDAFSPVQQLDGYIEMGDGPLWFCVDMNDSTQRYQVHHKDVEIQKPSHGDPCSFNVFEGGHIARITKLYRLQGNEAKTLADKNVHPAQLDTASQKRSKEKRSAALPKTRMQPFLQNCVITIVGGLRKWFEDVVMESGAELAHDSGDHPERITADLRRSQALFLLISSTSHRATWEGIDIAKAHGIPHFIIQGSKSNLRSLLWENRELILKANR